LIDQYHYGGKCHGYDQGIVSIQRVHIVFC
jgi:hypothetical protein